MAIVPERKLVTVLFCDLVGSTQLGEQLDAEALHSLKSAYFARVQSLIGAYHGVVEKFIGDAVVAIFGVPAVHEDDAERALLCALDITNTCEELNTTLRPKFGVGISVRIGVNTGEVMIDSTAGGDVIASGDVMNTAARLQQAADPGEVLAGRDTMLLTKLSLKHAGPKQIRMKGKAQPVDAWIALGTHSTEKRVETRLVGARARIADPGVRRGTVTARWRTTGRARLRRAGHRKDPTRRRTGGATDRTRRRLPRHLPPLRGGSHLVSAA
jgi:class 3 adenylate cyclase